MKRLLEQQIDASAIPAGRTLICGFVSLNTGTYHSVTHDRFASREDLVKGVLASAAIPIIWEPVEAIELKNPHELFRQNADGGLVNVSPLADTIRQINRDDDEDTEYHVIIINNSGGQLGPKELAHSNIFEIALRSAYEVTLNEIFNNDLREFMRINELVKEAELMTRGKYQPSFIDFDPRSNQPLRSRKSLKRFDYKIIEPEGNALGFALDVKGIPHRIQHGRAQAEKAFALADRNWPLGRTLPIDS